MARHYGVPPISNREAFAFLESFMWRPNVGFRDEPSTILPRWKSYADLTTSSPKRWMDAYLAAFAVDAGLEFVTGRSSIQSVRRSSADNSGLNVSATPPNAPAPKGRQRMPQRHARWALLRPTGRGEAQPR